MKLEMTDWSSLFTVKRRQLTRSFSSAGSRAVIGNEVPINELISGSLMSDSTEMDSWDWPSLAVGSVSISVPASGELIRLTEGRSKY